MQHLDFDGRRYVRAGGVKLLPPSRRTKTTQPEIDGIAERARALKTAGLSQNKALGVLKAQGEKIGKGRGAKWEAFRDAWNEES